MRQNRADAQWVQMPINAAVTEEKRAKTIQEIQQIVMQESVLQKTVRDLKLQEDWGMASEQQAMNRLKSSIFVREGEFRNPMTQEIFPTIDIGVRGKRKEKAILGKIAVQLAKETKEQLGLPVTP